MIIASRIYYLSSHKPRDNEIVMVQSLWHDDLFGFYIKDLNLFLDEDGLEIEDVLKWWRTHQEPSDKMKILAQECVEAENISIEELAAEIGF